MQVIVFKTHMCLNQIETDPIGQVRKVLGRCVVMPCSMLFKLNMIALTIRGWIDRCSKVWDKSSYIGVKQVMLGGGGASIYYLNQT